jgi:hypothetical protein
VASIRLLDLPAGSALGFMPPAEELDGTGQGRESRWEEYLTPVSLDRPARPLII